MANEQLHRIITDETGQKIADTLKELVDVAKDASVEYGVRFPVGASNPAGERVIRQNGVITPWNITFTKNVNNSAPNCPFAMIDLFAPGLWTDAGGNVFRRFQRFYYCKETIGNYEYWWVCRKQATKDYRLPKAFLPNWRYVDIGVYEAGNESVGSTTYLTSKTGTSPARSITRTVAFDRAKNWHSRLGIADLTKEYYSITTISEITEILQPLLIIQIGSKNSQSAAYRGHCDNSYAESNLISSGQTDTISGLHGTTANDGKHSFKMLGIENIWGNTWKHVLDVTILDYVPYVCDNLQNWTDTTTPNTNAAFAAAGYEVSHTGDSYVKELGYDIAHPEIALPTVVGGSDSTYYSDYYWVNSGARTVFFGGFLNDGSKDGLFSWSLHDDVGYSRWFVGARLSHRSV